jgi:hypothetical protein
MDVKPIGKIRHEAELKRSRERYYYGMAKKLGVSKEFVDMWFEKERNKTTPGRVDIGTKIRVKSGMYNKPKKKVPLDTKTLTKRMAQIKTRRQECTAKLTPLCLKVFVTNQEDTVCLRCQNYKI